MLNHELFRRLSGVFRNILPKDNQNTLIRITGRSSWSLARSNLFLPYLWEYGAKLNTYINILFPIQPNHDFSVFTGKTYSTMEYFVKKKSKDDCNAKISIKWSKIVVWKLFRESNTFTSCPTSISDSRVFNYHHLRHIIYYQIFLQEGTFFTFLIK